MVGVDESRMSWAAMFVFVLLISMPYSLDDFSDNRPMSIVDKAIYETTSVKSWARRACRV